MNQINQKFRFLLWGALAILTVLNACLYAITQYNEHVDRNAVMADLQKMQQIMGFNYSTIRDMANTNERSAILIESVKTNVTQASALWGRYYAHKNYFYADERALVEQFIVNRGHWLIESVFPILANQYDNQGNLETLYSDLNADLTALINLQKQRIIERNKSLAVLYALLIAQCLLIIGFIFFRLTARFQERESLTKKIKYPFVFTKYHYMYVGIFLAFFVVAYGIFYTLHEQEKHDEQQRIKLNGLYYSAIIQRRLENAFSSLSALNLAVIQNNGTNKNFHQIAKDILKKHPFVKLIDLAPQGIVRDIEPLVGNENVIGLNVLTRHEEAKEAQRAKDTGVLTLSGPLNLLQGGQGLLVYFPIHLLDKAQNASFFGFSIMLMDFAEVIDRNTLFNTSFLENFHYQIWKLSPFDNNQKQILDSTISLEEIEQHHLEPYDFIIEIPNGNWILSIYPKTHFLSGNTSLEITLICLFAMIATFFIKHILHNRHVSNIEFTYQEDHAAFEQACVFTETSTQGIILRVNDKLEKISGYSRAELVGSHQSIFRSGMHSNDFYTQLWSVIMAGDIWQGEICNMTKNKEFYWVQTIIVPVVDARGHVKKFFAFMTDITKQKQTEENRNELQTQLFQSQKMETIGHLTSGIAHDFNNILMAVTGFTNLGLSFIHKQNYDQAVNAFTKVEGAARRATSLVDKMLTFCRENTIKAETVIDPAVIIQEVIEIGEMLRSGISSSIRLDFNNAIEDKNIGILIDPSELHQLVTNLIINARDAIESHPLNNNFISVNLFVEHIDMVKCSACGVRFSGSFITLSVSDTGIGIPKENIASIFDPFYSTKEVGKGTGLGLSVVSGIVKNVGGHITVDSTVNEGTTISLLFPTINNKTPFIPTSAHPKFTAHIDIEREHKSSIKLLIVEDDEAICDLYNFEFTNLGYQVTCFSSSLEAWTQFSQDESYYDAVISDYGMPYANGLDLAKLILGIRPNIPIFICTGYSDKLKSDRDLPKGNTFLFKKPVDVDTLDTAIKQFFL